jgi:VanZ family protein
MEDRDRTINSTPRVARRAGFFVSHVGRDSMLDPVPPRIRRLLWVAWVLFLIAWTFALTTPYPVRASNATLPEESRFTASKALHVVGYASFSLLSSWLRLPGRWRWGLLAFLSLHAGVTEIIQTYVPERHGQWTDVTLNHFGLYLGVLLGWRWWRA